MDDAHLQSDADIEQILLLANERTDTNESLRQRLEASAAELGISPERLAEVEEAYKERKRLDAEKVAQQGDEARLYAQFKEREWNNLRNHFFAFLIVNLGLFVIDMMTSRGMWFLYSLVPWGLATLATYVDVTSNRHPDYDRNYAKWRKRQLKSPKPMIGVQEHSTQVLRGISAKERLEADDIGDPRDAERIE